LPGAVLGGYLVLPAVREELANVFAAARKAGATTVLDVVVPGPGDHRKQLDRLLPHVDVFLPNGHEAQVITGEPDPLRQAEAFRRLGAGAVVITMGGDGCVLVGDGTSGPAFIRSSMDSPAARAFDAGYIYGLLTLWGRRSVCVWPVRWGRAASAPSARPRACSRGRSARRF
jgi:sugar/nucleoside kinase (ribokinase family)